MNYSVIEPTLDDAPVFQITWETTLKCNLDCSYCSKNYHNNAIPHPTLEECLKTVDFLLEYVDAYMAYKLPSQRRAGLNVFGGESLFHPNIVEILDYIKIQHEQYKDKWSLSIQTITNAIVKEKIWDRIVDKIDYWTVSYHSETTIEQQDLFKQNLLDLKQKGKHFKCAIMMHPKHWNNSISMIEWCKDNNIPHLPRQLEHDFDFDYYKKDQIKWFDELYGITTKIPLHKKIISIINLDSNGRSCCGGNEMHVNADYSSSQPYIPNNNFKGWHCSVHYFFVFVKQVTKEVFVNKDCMMNFDGKIAPIGYLSDAQLIIDNIKQKQPPAIVCGKHRCRCGLCAPKAKKYYDYNNIMRHYLEPVNTVE